MNLKNLKRNNILEIAYVTILLIFGFLFRYFSIIENLSFWNDESHVAIYARGILEFGKPIDALGFSTGLYQLALYYITAASFAIFGITEFAARLPSIIVGSLLIPVIFYITKKMIGLKGAIIAATLMTFSQIQLAWSTQLRPYIWMELFTLIVIYLCYRSLQVKKEILDRNIILGGVITLVSFLFHGTGLINGLFLTGVLVYKIVLNREYRYFYLLIPAAAITLYIISFTPFFSALFRFNTYLYHYFVFLGYHYNWLILGAGLGTIVLWFKDRKLAILLAGGAAMIVGIALFKIHARYVRYSITAFPLLYMLFASGIIGSVDYVIKNKSKRFIWYIAILLILLAWPFYKEKMIITPKIYYSINADMRENPIVDYKLAFQKIEELIEGKDNVIIMDAWYDRVLWYLPGHEYVILFNSPSDMLQAGNPDSFGMYKAKYKYGVVIVENWQSQTSEELQNYIRGNLKHEFDVQTVPGNEKDPWSISVYSWGL